MLNANDVLEYKVIDGENPCDDAGRVSRRSPYQSA